MNKEQGGTKKEWVRKRKRRCKTCEEVIKNDLIKNVHDMVPDISLNRNRGQQMIHKVHLPNIEKVYVYSKLKAYLMFLNNIISMKPDTKTNNAKVPITKLGRTFNKLL